MAFEIEGNDSQGSLNVSSGKIGAKVDDKRVRAAILGALLADAASMGTHNLTAEEIQDLLGSNEKVEFQPNPPCPKGYTGADHPGHYEQGMLSPWGEQLLFATKYCGKHKCVTAGHMAVRFKEWCEDESNHGYLQDSSIQEFLKSMKQLDRSVELVGADDDRGEFIVV
jgi:ADP-ribosylglycohydrolase